MKTQKEGTPAIHPWFIQQLFTTFSIHFLQLANSKLQEKKNKK